MKQHAFVSAVALVVGVRRSRPLCRRRPRPAPKPTSRRSPPIEFEGRLAGSPGERLAGDYLIAELKRIGAQPLPGKTDYRLPFDFTAGTRDGGTTVSLECDGGACAPRTFNGEKDVRALSFSDNAEVSGPLVFAGYGIVVPEIQNFGYDSYVGLDVKDKIVVVLRYFPEDADPKTKAILARYSDLRYKAMAARQRGAKGIIVVTGPSSPNAGETIPMSFDTALVRIGDRRGEHQRRGRQRDLCEPGRQGKDAGRGAARARFRQSARRRLRHPQL